MWNHPPITHLMLSKQTVLDKLQWLHDVVRRDLKTMLVWQLYLEKVQCTNKNWTASISLKKESDHLQIFPTTKNQQKTKNTSFQDIHWGSTMAIISCNQVTRSANFFRCSSAEAWCTADSNSSFGGVWQTMQSSPPGWLLMGLLGRKSLIHPVKLTWNLKMNPWKRRFLLKTIIFRFHVSFRGDKPSFATVVTRLATGRSNLSHFYHDGWHGEIGTLLKHNWAV